MKKIIVILIVCFMSLFIVGCEEVYVENETSLDNSMFVLIEYTRAWKVVYHKETKVMFLASRYNEGTFTLMVDQDGKPLLWQGE